MNKYEQLPWHKQFWPWFIIALPASVVVAGIATLIIAIVKSDSLVDDDYYKEGLAINANLQQQRSADTLGLSVQVLISHETKRLDLRLHTTENSGFSSPHMLTLKLIHPFDASQDLQLPLQATEQFGLYSQRFQDIAEADWLLEISPLYLETPPHAQDWKIKTRLSKLEQWDS